MSQRKHLKANRSGRRVNIAAPSDQRVGGSSPSGRTTFPTGKRKFSLPTQKPVAACSIKLRRIGEKSAPEVRPFPPLRCAVSWRGGVHRVRLYNGPQCADVCRWRDDRARGGHRARAAAVGLRGGVAWRGARSKEMPARGLWFLGGMMRGERINCSPRRWRAKATTPPLVVKLLSPAIGGSGGRGCRCWHRRGSGGKSGRNAGGGLRVAVARAIGGELRLALHTCRAKGARARVGHVTSPCSLRKKTKRTSMAKRTHCAYPQMRKCRKFNGQTGLGAVSDP